MKYFSMAVAVMIYDHSASEERVLSAFRDSFCQRSLPSPRVIIYEKTDSTNTRAKLFAEERTDGSRAPVIFFAREQTGGRGTHGRAFESPVGGAYLSLLIYPEGDARDALALTALAAVGAVRALRSLFPHMHRVGIKWVNDLTVNDKKLGGILTEGKISDGGGLEYAIVGLGINLSPSATHSDGVRALMTTLEEEGGHASAEEVAAAISASIIGALSELGSEGIYREYRALSTLIGRRVTVTDPSGSYTATVKDINRDLSLAVLTEAGEEKSLISANVGVRPTK